MGRYARHESIELSPTGQSLDGEVFAQDMKYLDDLFLLG